MADYQKQNWDNIENYASEAAAKAAGIPSMSANSFNHMENGIYAALVRANEAYDRATTSPGGPGLASGFVHTDDYVLNGVYNTATLERAFAAATERNKTLVLGMARDSAGNKVTWNLDAAWVAEARYAHIIKESPRVKLGFNYDSPNAAYVIFKGSGASNEGAWRLGDLAITGKTQLATDKSVALQISGIRHLATGTVEVNNADAGLDWRDNCFGSEVGKIVNTFNSVNVGMVVAGTRAGNTAQSGSDLHFWNPWLKGRRAAIFYDGNQGGFHVHGGQLSAGTDASTQQNRGIIETGYDYLHPDFVYKTTGDIYDAPPTTNGYAPTGVSHVTFDRTTFEGAWYGDVLYAHELFFGEFHSPNVNGSKTGAQAMRGLFNFRNPGASRLAVTGEPQLGGTFRERNLYKLTGSAESVRFSETQWSTKLGDMVIAGESFPYNTMLSPMIYQGFTRGFTTQVRGTAFYSLENGTLYKTPMDGSSKVYFVGWPNLSEKTNVMAAKDLVQQPVDRLPTQPHALVWTGSAYPARPPTGYAHYLGPNNPKNISGLTFVKGDRWTQITL